MDKYLNRQQAGIILARELKLYRNRKDVLVLALPRGGVPVAYEIAKALHVPLDVFIVRKLGVPGHSELAMGAIATGDVKVFNNDIIDNLALSKDEIQSVMAEEKKELRRRELVYRGHQPFPDIKNKTIILVDDGIATGATLRAAILALKQLDPIKIIVAVPVAEKKLSDQMALQVDEFFCPLRPVNFHAVGAWYDDFSQTEDDEVHSLLRKAHGSR